MQTYDFCIAKQVKQLSVLLLQSALQVNNIHAAALQDEVQRLQDELGSARAAALDCQEMLEELQAFSEKLQQEHASLKDQLQVHTKQDEPSKVQQDMCSRQSCTSLLGHLHLWHWYAEQSFYQ